MALASTGFFKNLPPQPTEATKQTAKTVDYVDVGGNGDCGFRAIAAAIISKELYESNTMFFENRNSAELNALLIKHFEYFPEQKPSLPHANAIDQLRWLTNSNRMVLTIQSLAYTIRQMAVDEMTDRESCAKYRGAFVNDGVTPTSPATMRQPTTWIDETAIAAAAKATGYPIRVRVVSEGKEIPMHLHYEGKKERSANPLVIQLQEKHYIPCVMNPTKFQSVKTVSAVSLTPTQVKKNDPDIEEVLAIIAQEDKRLLENFEDTKRRLTAAVEADGATKELLLNIYIEGLKKSDYFQGYVGIEHGSEHFFKALKESNSELRIVRNELMNNPNQHFTNQLIHAIARAVTIEQLDANHVFDQIEALDKRAGARIG
ncbi:hypothetical protein [Legionella jamestowniensis]|uniref:Uncharacterized protein n=1 Tax=Legionella jamestowniensis TaxID=455 RepID=A0A0W0UI69_9GAMM|nr:hypothetical protein [Legionella jamestowniensis]KTD07601.1 hypothetical protein Ljam_1796 [Legionella jamestowniensis]SFL59233.1 hypothetical protein SAMN02746073_0914 [Legionella jamestowniensis DSM 19215]